MRVVVMLNPGAGRPATSGLSEALLEAFGRRGVDAEVRPVRPRDIVRLVPPLRFRSRPRALPILAPEAPP